MKKKPVITPMKTHDDPKFAVQSERKVPAAVSGMKYGDAEWRHACPILSYASLG
jgi:hypothetical protein